MCTPVQQGGQRESRISAAQRKGCCSHSRQKSPVPVGVGRQNIKYAVVVLAVMLWENWEHGLCRYDR